MLGQGTSGLAWLIQPLVRESEFAVGQMQALRDAREKQRPRRTNRRGRFLGAGWRQLVAVTRKTCVAVPGTTTSWGLAGAVVNKLHGPLTVGAL